ncbi:hypothetical protein D3C87_1160220 [compost metagenome]
MQQCLGRHAANVQARTAERVTSFHASGFQTQLTRADRCVVAAWPTAEYHDVVSAHGYSPGLKGIGWVTVVFD